MRGIGGGENGVGIAAIPRVSSGFNSPSEDPLKGIPIMDATAKMVRAIAGFWWWNDQRNDEWRDDGESKRGRSPLDMALNFSCFLF